MTFGTKLKLAACGIDCAECGSYKATVYRDAAAAEELVPWYRDMGWIGADEGAEAVLRRNPLCKGCWDIDDECFFKCQCVYKPCCIGKAISHCGECDDFPCVQYKEFSSACDVYQKAYARLVALRKQV
jgi:hypothetical protein